VTPAAVQALLPISSAKMACASTVIATIGLGLPEISASCIENICNNPLGPRFGAQSRAALSLAVAKTWQVDFHIQTTPLPNWLTVQIFWEVH
jgi:hypothetical protein